jgi:uncharacterized protein with HEPN domain
MRDDHERLQDILEAIAQIERYTSQGRENFYQNELIQVWTMHHLQIIGEASNSLSKTLLAQYPTVPWTAIIEFRNILAHEYFRINLDIVWRIVERDLPNLKSQIEAIMQEL